MRLSQIPVETCSNDVINVIDWVFSELRDPAQLTGSDKLIRHIPFHPPFPPTHTLNHREKNITWIDTRHRQLLRIAQCQCYSCVNGNWDLSRINSLTLDQLTISHRHWMATVCRNLLTLHVSTHTHVGVGWCWRLLAGRATSLSSTQPYI